VKPSAGTHCAADRYLGGEKTRKEYKIVFWKPPENNPLANASIDERIIL
jgi:hypothetical protein